MPFGVKLPRDLLKIAVVLAVGTAILFALWALSMAYSHRREAERNRKEALAMSKEGVDFQFAALSPEEEEVERGKSLLAEAERIVAEARRTQSPDLKRFERELEEIREEEKERLRARSTSKSEEFRRGVEKGLQDIQTRKDSRASKMGEAIEAARKQREEDKK